MESLNSQSILPYLYEEYKVGMIIEKREVSLFSLKNQYSTLEKEEEQAEQQKAEALLSKQYTVASRKEKEGMLAELNARIIRARRHLKGVRKQIKNIEYSFLIPVREELPIDGSKIRMVEDYSLQSDKTDLHHFTFRKSDNRTREDLERVVQEKILKEIPSSYLASLLIKQSIEKIELSLEDENEISMISSFLHLNRVQVVDPIIIRPHARIRKELKENAENYYVLTEAILGGVFLGFGNKISTFEQVKSQDSKRKNMTRLSNLSVISKGLPVHIKGRKLEKVLDQWKVAILSDPKAGYPIGFRYRSLQEILMENGLLPH